MDSVAFCKSPMKKWIILGNNEEGSLLHEEKMGIEMTVIKRRSREGNGSKKETKGKKVESIMQTTENVTCAMANRLKVLYTDTSSIWLRDSLQQVFQRTR